MGISNSPAYRAIRDFYADRVAKRSQVPLINHIDEGLKILDLLGATGAAKEAYCLHPLFQNDEALQTNAHRAAEFGPHVVMLVMEYRARANDALSVRVGERNGQPYWFGKPPSPGPLPEVRHMLIADKVQNYRDFRIHHKGTHARWQELDFYFRRWLEALDIDREPGVLQLEMRA